MGHSGSRGGLRSECLAATYPAACGGCGLNSLPSTKTRTEIKNEVRPSTVRTWLTCWRRTSTQPIDHRMRAVAVERMRTPCATIILARRGFAPHPTRPRREMQSIPPPPAVRLRLHRSRGPPTAMPSKSCGYLLTGNSVENVRRQAAQSNFSCLFYAESFRRERAGGKGSTNPPTRNQEQVSGPTLFPRLFTCHHSHLCVSLGACSSWNTGQQSSIKAAPALSSGRVNEPPARTHRRMSLGRRNAP